MQFFKISANRLLLGVLVSFAAVMVAAAGDRGPIQQTATSGERLASAPSMAALSASEDGSVDGSRIAPADRNGRHLYIVRFNEPSLARYEGGIEGFAATSPRVTGERLNARSSAAAAYRDFLAQRQDDYLAQMGQFARRDLQPTFQYLNVLNGVAVRLSPEEADRVAGLPFVAAIEIDRLDDLHTDQGPDLIRAPEFWDGLVTGGVGSKGEGVVIGIMDSGFNHGHPSFAEEASDGYVHINPYGDGVFTGVCADPGAADYEDVCNNKLIGAYALHPDSTTAEDTAASGHGTHVGSTAGGNPVTATVFGQTVEITGVAPRANLINYKVCEPLCTGAARIAAVNFAIDDGVHVLNHSIGNAEPPWASAVSLAFLDANAAGIVVAASAGNSGPGASTAASTGPWNMAVGASTHQRIFAQEVELAGLTAVPGVPGSGPELAATFVGNLRWAGDVDGANIRGCAAFPANAFDGEVALIQRGDCTFAEKVNNAVAAGAEFVIVYNSQGGAPTPMGGLEGTTVSSVMIADSDGAAFIAELGGGVASVTIDPAVNRFTDEGFADIMGGFSSRGPASHNTITPAVTAPGVSILAASTVANGNFAFLQGTSMSSPHVAGAAALLVAQHPDWTPTEIRSALTLSANPNHRKEDGVTDADPFDMGSGRIDVAAAGNIGFVMDESIANFVAANPAEGGDPGELNLSSIKNSSCVVDCSYQRTIRSVVGQAIDYSVFTDVPAGVSISVSPSSFTLPAGGQQVLDITIDVSGAAFDEWLFGAIRIEQDPLVVSRNAVISEDFEGAFPPAGWEVNNLGGDCDWRTNADDTRPNYAGGQGLSASADSDRCGSGSTMDTELVTPAFSPTEDFELSFDVSYRHLGSSRLDVEISTDGLSWDLLESFTASLSPTGPGENRSYSLAAYAGETDVRVRFRYVAGWDYWAQVDNVVVGEPPEPLVIADTRMPVAVIAREPNATIAVSPLGLSATQQTGEQSQQQFTISNTGALALDWSLTELGPRGTGNQVSGVIWDNPQLNTSGRINNFSIPDDTGIYQTDAFALLAPASIETIFSAGFILGNPGVTTLNWMVFPDDNGVPAGDPENNPGAAIWSFSAAPTATGVSFADADMSLDLAAAGAPPLNLDPGVYWLVAYPDVQQYSLGPNNLYAWFHGASGTGRQIGPGGLGGFPTSWSGAPEGRAFTLTGTLDCGEVDTPWLDVSPTSGTIDPGLSTTVDVDFDAAGLAEGSYGSALCIVSNDPESPATFLPVQLNVVNLPAAAISSNSESMTVDFGDSETVAVVISNSGLGELEFEIYDGSSALTGGLDLLFDQTASETTSGTLAIYDLDGPATWAVQSADDFSVPFDQVWSVDQVIANGFYQALVNPASVVRVYFYEDADGAPGDEIAAFLNVTPSNDDAGRLTLDLPTTVSLTGGTYWVSVQPEMDWGADGRWFWYMNEDQAGSEFHWRNPGDGYSTGCTDWGPASVCGFGNPDQSFQLFGQSADLCEPISSVTWLSVDPASGTVAPEGGEQTVELTAIAGGAIPGSYSATICFATNDGDNPLLPVEVNLTVTGDAPDQIFGDRFQSQD